MKKNTIFLRTYLFLGSFLSLSTTSYSMYYGEIIPWQKPASQNTDDRELSSQASHSKKYIKELLGDLNFSPEPQKKSTKKRAYEITPCQNADDQKLSPQASHSKKYIKELLGDLNFSPEPQKKSTKKRACEITPKALEKKQKKLPELTMPTGQTLFSQPENTENKSIGTQKSSPLSENKSYIQKTPRDTTNNKNDDSNYSPNKKQRSISRFFSSAPPTPRTIARKIYPDELLKEINAKEKEDEYEEQKINVLLESEFEERLHHLKEQAPFNHHEKRIKKEAEKKLLLCLERCVDGSVRTNEFYENYATRITISQELDTVKKTAKELGIDTDMPAFREDTLLEEFIKHCVDGAKQRVKNRLSCYNSYYHTNLAETNLSYYAALSLCGVKKTNSLPPIHQAIEAQDIKKLQKLIKTTKHEQDSGENTALHHIAATHPIIFKNNMQPEIRYENYRYENYEVALNMIDLLLANGALKTTKNELGKTPYQLAQEKHSFFLKEFYRVRAGYIDAPTLSEAQIKQIHSTKKADLVGWDYRRVSACPLLSQEQIKQTETIMEKLKPERREIQNDDVRRFFKKRATLRTLPQHNLT